MPECIDEENGNCEQAALDDPNKESVGSIVAEPKNKQGFYVVSAGKNEEKKDQCNGFDKKIGGSNQCTSPLKTDN